MSKKVLVTKEFHRQALHSIERLRQQGLLDMEEFDVVRMAWMSYMENCLSEEEIERFVDYCDKYLEEKHK